MSENLSRREFLKVAGLGATALGASAAFGATQKTPASQSATKREGFYVARIDDALFARIKGKTFKDDCPLPLDDLRYLHLLHKDLNGATKEGEMICSVYIAAALIDIFRELYKANYPIEKIRLMDEYGADDETAMRDNNSSCFNFRFITHTTKISKHGLGLAVDINTLYNPYVKYTDKGRILEPATAEKYLDRDANFPYKIDKNSLCYKLFTSRGFEWGGEWQSCKDYQHFELSDETVKILYPDYR